jgi:hypothetical protein
VAGLHAARHVVSYSRPLSEGQRRSTHSGESKTENSGGEEKLHVVCVCVCVRARARVCVCVCVYVFGWGGEMRAHLLTALCAVSRRTRSADGTNCRDSAAVFRICGAAEMDANAAVQCRAKVVHVVVVVIVDIVRM